jgi:hypothetical protein
MATYNPSAPNTIGLEWEVATESVTPLSTTTSCAAFLCTSTATETITNIYLPHNWSGPGTGYGKLAVDVYDLASTGAGGTPTVTQYAPTGDTSTTNVFAPSPSWGSALTAGNVFTKLDDGTSYNDADYCAYTATSYSRHKFGTAAVTGQISSVSFYVRAFGYSGTSGKLNVDLYNGTTYVSTLGSISPPGNGDDTPRGFATYTIGPFTTNPLTGVAWTATDVANMSTGTNLLVQLTLVNNNVSVSWLSIVVSAGTDSRKATGATALQTTLPSGYQTNLPCVLASPWSKVSGTSYLIVARRIDDPTGAAATLIPQPVFLASAATPWTGKSYSATIDSSGFLTSAGSADATKTYPFWLGTNGGAISVDSQPYWDLKIEPVHATSTCKQFVSGASGQAYKALRFAVGYKSGSTPQADLTVKLRRTSDNVQFGGNATLTTTAWATSTSLGTIVDNQFSQGNVTMRLAQIDLATSGTLATSTDYYLEFTSAATSAWFLGMLDATASHALTGNVTYAGSTDQANVAGVGVPQADFIARIAAAPATPSSITVTNTTTTINGTSIDYAAISWVETGSLGAAFLRWEIDRSEDAAVTWVNIATIATEATLTFSDYEAKRNNANKYRVRIVRSDGANSDYVTETGTVTPAAVVGAKALFTTNALSSLTVGYVPDGTDATYEFLSASETVYLALHNRDYQASFKPLEQRGIRWSFRVQVFNSTGNPSAGAGVQAYTVLRAIADSATPPYLCLHTGDGERFFGTIVVPQGQRDLATGVYFAQVTFTQTQAAPTVVAL